MIDRFADGSRGARLQGDEGLRQRLREVVDGVGGADAASKIIGGRRSSIYKWLAGKARLPLFPAAMLCRASGHSLHWLATGNPPPPPPAPVFPPEFVCVPPLTMADIAKRAAR